jgi:hypothetical protein
MEVVLIVVGLIAIACAIVKLFEKNEPWDIPHQ